MSFSGVISLRPDRRTNGINLPAIENDQTLTWNVGDDEQCRIVRCPHPKCERDSCVWNDDEHLTLLDGVLLNATTLQAQFKPKSPAQILAAMYARDGERSIGALWGEFRGVVLDKRNRRLFLFTNQTGTKSVFFYQSDDYLFFSSRLQQLVKIVRSHGLPVNPDRVASYVFLLFGHMLGEKTWIREIPKLMAGTLLALRGETFSVETYHDLSTITPTTLGREEVIEELERRFATAIQSEFQKDCESGYRHLVTLSGGLDSRMTLLCAIREGFTDTSAMTFAQDNSRDHKIAMEICESAGVPHLFYSLNSARFLCDYKSCFERNDGLQSYDGAAHSRAAIDAIDFNDYGILHTGQLGDAVLGTYLNAPIHTPPSPPISARLRFIADMIADDLRKESTRYPNDELFTAYNRGFNYIVNGYWVVQTKTEAVSPFLHPEFMDFALSIPPLWRYKQQIYVDWIQKKHPDVGQFKWAASGLKPGALQWRKTLKRTTDAVGRRLLKKLTRTHESEMNPHWYWFATKPWLQRFLDDSFVECLDAVCDAHLRDDCQKVYYSHVGDPGVQMRVFSLCYAWRRFFGHS